MKSETFLKAVQKREEYDQKRSQIVCPGNVPVKDQYICNEAD